MLVEIILIGVSIIIMFLLISIRYFSLAYAKSSSNFLYKSDKKINSYFFGIKRFFNHLTESVTDFFKNIPHLLLNILNKILFKLYKKTKKLVDLIKGNKVPTNKGSVSLFLKRIEKKD